MPQHSRATHDELVRKIEHLHEHMLMMKQAQEDQAKLLARTFRKVGKLMTILDDIKTINAETKEKVVNIGVKLDAAVARIAGFKEAIAALKARIEELIAQGAGEISAEDAAGLVTAAQEIEDAADADTAKADILANTEGDDA